jgi:hypothetical protein
LKRLLLQSESLDNFAKYVIALLRGLPLRCPSRLHCCYDPCAALDLEQHFMEAMNRDKATSKVHLLAALHLADFLHLVYTAKHGEDIPTKNAKGVFPENWIQDVNPRFKIGGKK